MSNYIEKEIIEQVRKNSDIVDVISQYISVEKKGKNYVCVCPFHDDHSPSMHIHKDKQIFRCFACGASGNVISFVRDYEKCSFNEAVAKLGKPLGININLQKTEVKIDLSKKPYYDINQEAILYTSYQILVNEIALNYLKSRDILKSQIDKFQIGYDDGKLNYYLKEKGFDYELMKEAYLIHDSIDYFDVFKERIVFPIHDLEGNPVGFTGRTLVNSAAKYINTSETKVYVKGNLIYNYHRVKQNLNKYDCVYLVEGTMDVIAFDKAGIENCVATLGTAVTPEQIKALKRLNLPIYVCFDGDNAGRSATYKFGLLASANQLKFEIVDWNSLKDPDEFLSKEGKQQFLNTIEKTISWIQFIFEYLKIKYNLENYSDKKQYATEIALEIAKIHDEIERKAYYEVLKNITSFDYSNQKARVNKVVNPVFKNSKSGLEKAQFEILNQILHSKRACDLFVSQLGNLPNYELNEIAHKIINLYYTCSEIEVSDLFSELNQNQSRIIAEILENELYIKKFNEDVVNGSIVLIRLYHLESTLKNLKKQIFNEQVYEKKTELMKKAIELTAMIDRLKKGDI